MSVKIHYPDHVIVKGSTLFAAIKSLKQRLNELGFGPLDANNANFGESTEAAVKKFQDANQLLADGIVGELTWERLFTISLPVKPSSLSLNMRALEVADSQLYVREKTGRNDGVEVESYLKSVGLGKGYAWCASFVYWCFCIAADQLGLINPLPKTGGVLDHWARTKGRKVFTPMPGDIFVMDFGEGKGHTGLVSEVKESKIYAIEGNTNSQNSREGDGVYERVREMKSINKGYIRY